MAQRLGNLVCKTQITSISVPNWPQTPSQMMHSTCISWPHWAQGCSYWISLTNVHSIFHKISPSGPADINHSCLKIISRTPLFYLGRAVLWGWGSIIRVGFVNFKRNDFNFPWKLFLIFLPFLHFWSILDFGNNPRKIPQGRVQQSFFHLHS